MQGKYVDKKGFKTLQNKNIIYENKHIGGSIYLLNMGMWEKKKKKGHKDSPSQCLTSLKNLKQMQQNVKNQLSCVDTTRMIYLLFLILFCMFEIVPVNSGFKEIWIDGLYLANS